MLFRSPVVEEEEGQEGGRQGQTVAITQPLGRSKVAATIAVAETATSRVINALPVMTIPPLMLFQLRKTRWMHQRPNWTIPVNMGLILGTSLVALPLALGVFPQRHYISADRLEPELTEFADKSVKLAVFNRGM